MGAGVAAVGGPRSAAERFRSRKGSAGRSFRRRRPACGVPSQAASRTVRPRKRSAAAAAPCRSENRAIARQPAAAPRRRAATRPKARCASARPRAELGERLPSGARAGRAVRWRSHRRAEASACGGPHLSTRALRRLRPERVRTIARQPAVLCRSGNRTDVRRAEASRGGGPQF